MTYQSWGATVPSVNAFYISENSDPDKIRLIAKFLPATDSGYFCFHTENIVEFGQLSTVVPSAVSGATILNLDTWEENSFIIDDRRELPVRGTLRPLKSKLPLVAVVSHLRSYQHAYEIAITKIDSLFWSKYYLLGAESVDAKFAEDGQPAVIVTWRDDRIESYLIDLAEHRFAEGP